MRAATQSGLVALNANGDVVPDLAERWLVTDGGRTFIFRLRESDWPDGSPLTAESVADRLEATLADLKGTSLGLDLAPVEEVRAMAGRVVELRLSEPEPYLLQLLAQPELALGAPGGDTGAMTLARTDGSAELALRPPGERGLPQPEDWQDDVRAVNLMVTDARHAIALFNDNRVQMVLGGDLGSLPLVDTGPLSTGTLRIDSTFGLFGLRVRRAKGLLGSDRVREALAMAIDRQALLARYNIGGWVATTRPVAPGLPGDPGLVAERWADADIEELREEARARIGTWQRAAAADGEPASATLSVALPEGRGWDLLYRDLAQQWASVGVTLERAGEAGAADLVLVDAVARYPAPRWFLNQFACSLRRGPCLDDADTLVAQGLAEADPAQRAVRFAEAEAQLTLANVFIPLGAPLRWTLVRGGLEGYQANAYGWHPLPPLAEIPR
ncbi:peptide ABC transporter substrate-binding protein [Aurantiacibacter spongiae]|uniref:Peptide ABC transporter substrate-binding protein n=1 Tax=Aurantiacibacter spongiae TaxID=2488860 RepID=A0A3N5CU27_9SPHN|nr:peptide ABC transporter substrate-binding protein [Aurantiacibacter spongiae]